MPMKYIAEMFCDRIAASKIYEKENYTDASAYNYFKKGIAETLMYPDTAAETEKMLTILKDKGEDAAFAYVRRRLKEAKELKSK